MSRRLTRLREQVEFKDERYPSTEKRSDDLRLTKRCPALALRHRDRSYPRDSRESLSQGVVFRLINIVQVLQKKLVVKLDQLRQGDALGFESGDEFRQGHLRVALFQHACDS